MLGIHDLWLFIISGLLLNVTPGPDTAYIIGRSVQLGWRGGARPVGAAGGVIGRVRRGEMGRCSLSLLHRRENAAIARTAACGRGGHRKRRDFAAPGVAAGRAHQRAQSEGCAVLSGFPAAIRRGGFAAQDRGVSAARADLHFQRHALVPWRGGVRRKGGRQSGQALRWINRALGGLFVYLGVRVAKIAR